MPPDALAAVDELIDDRRSAGDYQALFYALLMRKRVELGVSPFPLGPAADLPDDAHADYEDAIRAAARHVGGLYLTAGDITQAWPFYRMLGESDPVRRAMRDYVPAPDADVYPVVEIAWQQAVWPERGFDLVLDRSGVCSAVTMVQSADLRASPAVRDYCVGRLVRALHAQLSERLRADAEHRDLAVPDGATVPEMVGRFPQLTADDNYHVDVSHLSSVCTLAMQLPAGPDAELALELCGYGQHLAPGLRGDPGVPFEETYTDYAQYLNVTAGRDVAGGLSHFETKLARAVELDPDDARFVAEVLVTLYLAAGRPADALAVGRRHLAGVPEAHLTCPGPTELARRANDYAGLAADADAAGDKVTALAARLAARTTPGAGAAVSGEMPGTL